VTLENNMIPVQIDYLLLTINNQKNLRDYALHIYGIVFVSSYNNYIMQYMVLNILL